MKKNQILVVALLLVAVMFLIYLFWKNVVTENFTSRFFAESTDTQPAFINRADTRAWVDHSCEKEPTDESGLRSILKKPKPADAPVACL